MDESAEIQKIQCAQMCVSPQQNMFFRTVGSQSWNLHEWRLMWTKYRCESGATSLVRHLRTCTQRFHFLIYNHILFIFQIREMKPWRRCRDHYTGTCSIIFIYYVAICPERERVCVHVCLCMHCALQQKALSSESLLSWRQTKVEKTSNRFPQVLKKNGKTKKR